MCNTGYGEDTFGGPGNSNFNNSANKLVTADMMDVNQIGTYRNSSLPEGLSTSNISKAAESYNKRIFAVPRIDLTSSFKGHDSTNPWSYKSENIPSAIYVSRKSDHYNEY